MVLQSLSNQIQKKKKKLLKALVVVSGGCPGPAPALLPSPSSASGPPALPAAAREEALGARTLLPPQKSQQPHQEALLQKTRDSQDMLKCMDKFREVRGHGRGRPLCEGAEGQAPGPVGVRLVLIWRRPPS